MTHRFFNKNIFKMELRRNLKSFLIWSTAICGIVFFGMMFYPAINTGELLAQVQPIFETPMMRGLLSVFGADLSNLSNLMGYYVTYNSFYNILLGCIFISVLAGNLLAKEEAEKTADFLLTRPVSRFSVYLSKVSVLLCYSLLLSILFFLISLFSMNLLEDEAGRVLDLSESEKRELIRQVELHPEKIYEAFDIDDDSFSEYALMYASRLLAGNPSELSEHNLNINDMNLLITEAMDNPEMFFESVINSPEKYMQMFSVGDEQRAEFLQNVENERLEYLQMKEEFYSSPDIFIMFLEQTPDVILGKYTLKQGTFASVERLLELPAGYEQRLFMKYSAARLGVFCTYVFMLLFCMGSVVLSVSLMAKRGGSVIGFSIGIVFVLYFLKSITALAAGFSDAAQLIGYLSPFSWIDTEINGVNYGFSCRRLLVFTAVTAAAITTGGVRFNRKDILL